MIVLSRSNRAVTLYTVLILLLGLLLRLPHLNGSFWLDEAAQALQSVRPLSQQLQIAEDFQPPLLHLMIHFASSFSHSEWWLRTVGALIPGLVTIWATIQIGTRLHHPKTGLLAGFLLATSPFHLFFSQELRPYSLPTMWATLSWLVLFTWQTPRRFELHRPPSFILRSATLYTLFTAAGLYSSYLYPFLFLSQICYFFWYKRSQIAPYLMSAAAAATTFLPWMPFFLEQLAVGGELRTALPGWDAVVSFSQLKSVPLVFAKFIYGIAPISADPYTVVSFGLLIVTGLTLVVSSWQRKKLPQTLIQLSIWLIVPLFSAWIVSFFVPVIQPKRVLYLLPAFYLIVSVLTARYLQTQSLLYPNLLQRLLRKSPPLRTHLAAVLFVVLLTTVNVAGVYRYYVDPTVQRENWRALYTEVCTAYPTTSAAVLFSFPAPFAPWQWYELEARNSQSKNADSSQCEPLPIIATGVIHVDQIPDLSAQLAQLQNYQTVFIFDYLRDLTDPDDRIRETVTRFGYSGTGVLEYPNIGFVRIYEARN